jgi:hypothetical protein
MQHKEENATEQKRTFGVNVKCDIKKNHYASEGVGNAVAQLAESLRYKPEGRGFDSRWCH